LKDQAEVIEEIAGSKRMTQKEDNLSAGIVTKWLTSLQSIC
jgi:hypothetical protein